MCFYGVHNKIKRRKRRQKVGGCWLSYILSRKKRKKVEGRRKKRKNKTELVLCSLSMAEKGGKTMGEKGKRQKEWKKKNEFERE